MCQYDSNKDCDECEIFEASCDDCKHIEEDGYCYNSDSVHCGKFMDGLSTCCKSFEQSKHSQYK